MAAFPKEDLVALAWGEHAEGFDVISDDIVGTGRWTINHRIVFTHDGRFYESHYEVGATEDQDDEEPYGYDTDPIECREVFAIEKTVTVYVPAAEAAS